MELSLIITQKIAVMFGIVLIGFICAKIKLIDPQTNKRLSGIALYLVTPMLIFKSYQSTFDARIVRNLLWSFLLVASAYVVMIPLALALVRQDGELEAGQVPVVSDRNALARVKIALRRAVMRRDSSSRGSSSVRASTRTSC